MANMWEVVTKMRKGENSYTEKASTGLTSHGDKGLNYKMSLKVQDPQLTESCIKVEHMGTN